MYYTCNGDTAILVICVILVVLNKIKISMLAVKYLIIYARERKQVYKVHINNWYTFLIGNHCHLLVSFCDQIFISFFVCIIHIL